MLDFTSVLTAIITGGITLLGVIFSNNTKTAVLEEKLAAMKASIDKHNNFAERVPILEEQMKVVNHRLADVEEELKR